MAHTSRLAFGRTQTLVLAAILMLATFAAVQAPGVVARSASVANVFRPKFLETFRTFDADGAPLSDTSWRVVEGTGNCCENYLAATPAGRLVDLGGGYLNFSDDRGLTWKRVIAQTGTIISAEGAVVAAPGGDIVGMTWDPYSGDRIFAVKYDGARGTWTFNDVPVHEPFFDRPWIAVFPGPWTVGTETFPYMSVLVGGLEKRVTHISFDGLNYTAVGARANYIKLAEQGWLTLPEDPLTDAIQPHSESRMSPLPGRGGVGIGGIGCPAMTMRGDVPLWACHQTLGEFASFGERVLADSRGYLHRMTVFSGAIEYGVSVNGGETVQSTSITLPDDARVEDWDFKTQGERTVLAVHAHVSATGTDQDFLFTFGTPDGVPTFERRVHLGRGDMDFDSGLGGSRRFDFTNVVFLPDGKIAASFVDSVHDTSSIAIEL